MLSLVEIAIPSPLALRGGWAAIAAVCASRGWADAVYAEGDSFGRLCVDRRFALAQPFKGIAIVLTTDDLPLLAWSKWP
ncbi:MAG: hypothetical protein HLUCCA11_18410 [Phormidesmis priestleyi Ana]|uniref:Uncharacterized protein n=1 Tax=Phormidesmis priestleyi Ana TaxID=1666911 RepID=A0A0P8BX49_9CYAN|nr:MAG: hypothetical protein HLUCCA11_18410 [Phormidesmis priestleyi Ana]